jgi:hypothetical protein
MSTQHLRWLGENVGAGRKDQVKGFGTNREIGMDESSQLPGVTGEAALARKSV